MCFVGMLPYVHLIPEPESGQLIILLTTLVPGIYNLYKEA
jgi:hypothetical protein